MNGFCTPTEHLHHNHLDAMMVYVQKFLLLVGIVPGLFKADMDSAYRRVPIDVDHIWASGIAFLCGVRFGLQFTMHVPLVQLHRCMAGNEWAL